MPFFSARIPSPRPLPNSGSFLGPNTSSAMAKITRRCRGWNNPSNINPPNRTCRPETPVAQPLCSVTQPTPGSLGDSRRVAVTALDHVPPNYFGDLSSIPQAVYFDRRAILARQNRKAAGGLRETLGSEIAFASSGGRLFAG